MDGTFEKIIYESPALGSRMVKGRT